MSINEARLQVQSYQGEVVSLRQELFLTRQLLNETIFLLGSLGLDKDVTESMRTITELIMLINSLRMTIMLLESASGPVGWVMVGAHIAQTAIIGGRVASDMMGDRG